MESESELDLAEVAARELVELSNFHTAEVEKAVRKYFPKAREAMRAVIAKRIRDRCAAIRQARTSPLQDS